jgi:hypothetical protein
MYGKHASTTLPGGAFRAVNAPLHGENRTDISFPASGDLDVLLSAYGFDWDPKTKVSYNAHPTAVTIYSAADDTMIASREFKRDSRTATVAIPTKYKDAGIYIVTETTEDKLGRDTDEVQVQISTTGKIAITGTERPKRRNITFSPRPSAAVEARELFENSSFTANIDYVKNQDSKAEILGFAKSLNDQDIVDVVGGTRSLDSIFALTGGGVNPETQLPAAKDKKTKDVDRFGLQDYPAAELMNLYKEKSSAQDYFDSLRSAKATKGRSAAGFETYKPWSYSTDEGLRELLEDHGSICHHDWSQTIVSIEDATTHAKLSDEEVAAILQANNITNYGGKSAQNSGKIDIASFTSPLGIARGPDAAFEKNYKEILPGSETDTQLRPIMQGSPKTLGRRNNDLLSALRAADFVKYLLLQKARQMDDQQKSGTKWMDSLHEAFVKRNLLVTVNVTGEHGTEQKPVPVRIYMKDIPEPKVK